MDNFALYKGLSKVYDLLDIIYFRDNNRNPRKALSDFINKQDAKILDICTGTATNAITIAKNHKNVNIIGIDISQEMLHIAENKVKNNGLYNIELFQMDASDTIYEDNTFDVILISLVLHELPNKLASKILLEAKRILKPEGKLLVMEWEEPQSFIKKILFYFVRKSEPKGFEQFLKNDMHIYFKEYNFAIKEIKHCDYTKVLSIKNASC